MGKKMATSTKKSNRPTTFYDIMTLIAWSALLIFLTIMLAMAVLLAISAFNDDRHQMNTLENINNRLIKFKTINPDKENLIEYISNDSRITRNFLSSVEFFKKEEKYNFYTKDEIFTKAEFDLLFAEEFSEIKKRKNDKIERNKTKLLSKNEI